MKYNIGNKIKILRKKSGCSQSDLAKYLEIGTQAVSKWERGVCAPDIELLPDIAAFFGVGMEELFHSGCHNDCNKALAELAGLAESGEWSKIVDKSIEYIRVFPSECSICEYLLYAIIREDMRGGNISETIRLKAINFGKRALVKCMDANLKYRITYHLCSILYEKGRNDEADYYYETLNSAIFSRESMDIFRYKGEENQKKLAENLAIWYGLLGRTLSALAYSMNASDESAYLLRKSYDSYVLAGEYGNDKGYLRLGVLNLLDIAISYEIMGNTVDAEKSFRNAYNFCKNNGMEEYFLNIVHEAVESSSFSSSGRALYKKMVAEYE